MPPRFGWPWISSLSKVPQIQLSIHSCHTNLDQIESTPPFFSQSGTTFGEITRSRWVPVCLRCRRRMVWPLQGPWGKRSSGVPQCLTASRENLEAQLSHELFGPSKYGEFNMMYQQGIFCYHVSYRSKKKLFNSFNHQHLGFRGQYFTCIVDYIWKTTGQ